MMMMIFAQEEDTQMCLLQMMVSATRENGGQVMSDFAKDTNVPTNDCISRQAAIDAVGWYSCHSGDKLLFADNVLKQLPSTI